MISFFNFSGNSVILHAVGLQNMCTSRTAVIISPSALHVSINQTLMNITKMLTLNSVAVAGNVWCLCQPDLFKMYLNQSKNWWRHGWGVYYTSRSFEKLVPMVRWVCSLHYKLLTYNKGYWTVKEAKLSQCLSHYHMLAFVCFIHELFTTFCEALPICNYNLWLLNSEKVNLLRTRIF